MGREARPVPRRPSPTTPLEQMRAAGEIDAATGDLTDLPQPLASVGELPSEVLAGLREHER